LGGIGGFLYVARNRPPRLPNLSQEAALGKRLTTLELQSLAKGTKQLALTDLAGKVTWIHLWGPWCTHCRIEMPRLNALRQEFELHQDFVLVSISCGPSMNFENLESLRAETTAYLGEEDDSVPVFCDPQGHTRRALVQLAELDDQGLSYPVSVLLSRNGVIRGFWTGTSDRLLTELGQAIRAELKQQEFP
jgi:thiol-disulfide isomerase/thioredoxin